MKNKKRRILVALGTIAALIAGIIYYYFFTTPSKNFRTII